MLWTEAFRPGLRCCARPAQLLRALAAAPAPWAWGASLLPLSRSVFGLTFHGSIFLSGSGSLGSGDCGRAGECAAAGGKATAWPLQCPVATSLLSAQTHCACGPPGLSPSLGSAPSRWLFSLLFRRLDATDRSGLPGSLACETPVAAGRPGRSSSSRPHSSQRLLGGHSVSLLPLPSCRLPAILARFPLVAHVSH